MEVQFKIFLTALVFAVISGIFWMMLKDEKGAAYQTAEKGFSLMFDVSFISMIISLIWMIWTL